MRIAIRMILVLALGIALFLLLDMRLTIRTDRRILKQSMTNAALLVGRSMQGLVADVWRTGGEERVEGLISDINRTEHPVRVRWIPLSSAPDAEVVAETIPPGGTALLAGDQPVILERHVHGEDHLYVHIPVRISETEFGTIELAQSLTPIRQHTGELIRKTGIVTGLTAIAALILATVAGIWFIGRPLDRLVSKVNRVGRGDLSGDVNLPGKSEFAKLAAGLNEMCRGLQAMTEEARHETEARVAAVEQLRHKDRLATVGTLASGMAHELGTPLNVVSGRASMIARGGLSQEETAKLAEVIKAQSQRMTAILKQLLQFARHRPAGSSRVDLRRIASDSTELLTPIANKQGVELSLEKPPSEAAIKADPGQIQQVITNLVMNSIQSMPTGGDVSVKVASVRARRPEPETATEQDWVCLSVADHGGGIAPDDVERIFDPFFTTKDVGGGTGLGLSIADGIVREHGGWIAVDSEVGKGSTFSVFFPIEREEGAGEA